MEGDPPAIVDTSSWLVPSFQHVLAPCSSGEHAIRGRVVTEVRRKINQLLRLSGRLDADGFRRAYGADTNLRTDMALPPLDSPKWHSTARRLRAGAARGRGHGADRWCCSRPMSASARWRMTPASASAGCWRAPLLVWAGPAQIILISTLGSGATVVQAAIAVTLSAIRLFPMVVAVLPMMRTPTTRKRELILPAHFVAVTLWVECFRLFPKVPRERRIPFTLGLGTGLVSAVPGRQCDRLWTCGQPAATVRRGDPAADAAGVSAVDRAQLPRTRRLSSRWAWAWRCFRWWRCCTPASTS